MDRPDVGNAVIDELAAERGPMTSLPHIAVVMPAFNEEQGLPGFLAEIAQHVLGRAGRLSMVVVDDCSTDGTAASPAPIGVELTVLVNAVNLGHGPSALRAYRGGLATGAGVIVHVDGDGQFSGADVARVVDALLAGGVAAVHGVRTSRDEAWFRVLITRLLHAAAVVLGRTAARDVNTPLRAYRRDSLEALLDRVPDDAMAPHVYFSILERTLRLEVRSLSVTSLPPRGAVRGTMFGRTRVLPSSRLLLFVLRAGFQILGSLRSLRAAGRPAEHHP